MTIQQKCPICEGHGIVPPDFYVITAQQTSWTSSNYSETCRNCNGTGVVLVKQEY